MADFGRVRVRGSRRQEEVPKQQTKTAEVPKQQTKTADVPKQQAKTAEVPKQQTKIAEVQEKQTETADVPKQQTKVMQPVKLQPPVTEQTEQAVQPKETESAPKQNVVYADFVLDTTLSMSRVYQRVYQILQILISEVKRYALSHDMAVFRFGLTCITDKGAKIQRFTNGIYTEDMGEFTDALKNLYFQGGSPDGYEKICESLEASVRKLQSVNVQEAYKGLILISDSIPHEEFYDFSHVDGKEAPLHFAWCYLYDCMEFNPLFDIASQTSSGSEMISSSVSDLSDLLHQEQEIINVAQSVFRLISKDA